MTARRLCPPAPGPLEAFAAQFDPLLHSFGQRRSWRTYWTGLLAPRDRHKTLTALAGAEPLVQAQAAEVQRLQFFLSEAQWNTEAFGARRLELLQAESATAAHAGGVLVLDDTGDRKGGEATEHVARQYLGSLGKTDQGIVAVTTLWADERLYYPLHVEPYTPAERLEAGKRDPAFRTKPQIALELIERAHQAGIGFRAVIADCFYGDNTALVGALASRKIPYVLAHRGGVGRGWAPEQSAHSFEEALEETALRAWQKIRRRFRDGHTETWWAVELRFLGFGPHRAERAICITTDRRTRPALSTWYLSTNLQHATLEEIVTLYAMRNWVESGYKYLKGELGWADFQVRSDRAIRRHWELVCVRLLLVAGCARGRTRPTGTAAPAGSPGEGEKKSAAAHRAPELAGGAAPGARVARPGALAHELLARVASERTGASTAAGRTARHRVLRIRTQPVSPRLTNQR